MHALRVSLEENLLIWNLYSVLVFLLFENEFIPTFQNLKNKQKNPPHNSLSIGKTFFAWSLRYLLSIIFLNHSLSPILVWSFFRFFFFASFSSKEKWEPCSSAVDLNESVFLTELLSVGVIRWNFRITVKAEVAVSFRVWGKPRKTQMEKRKTWQMLWFFFLIPSLPFLHFKSPKAESRGRFILFPLTPQRGGKGRKGNLGLLKNESKWLHVMICRVKKQGEVRAVTSDLLHWDYNIWCRFFCFFFSPLQMHCWDLLFLIKCVVSCAPVENRKYSLPTPLFSLLSVAWCGRCRSMGIYHFLLGSPVLWLK